MLNSDWLFFIAVGGILAFGLAFTALQYDHQNECAGCYGRSEGTNNSTRDYLSAFLFDRGDQTTVANPNFSRDEWRQEQDLKAQNDMADWAMIMAFFSGLGIVVTFAGVVYVAKTLDTSKAAVAAAVRNADEAKRIGEAQVRAYVALDRVDIFYRPLTHMFEASLIVVNSGNSPARKITTSARGEIIFERKHKDGLMRSALISELSSTRDMIAGRNRIPIEFERTPVMDGLVDSIRALTFNVELTGEDVFGNPFTGNISVMVKGGGDWNTPRRCMILVHESRQPVYHGLLTDSVTG